MAGADLTDLVPDVVLPISRTALDRTLYDRLLAHPDRYAQVLDSVRFATHTDYWYTPDSVLLMLLPTADVRTCGYCIDFYGALTPEDQEKRRR